MPIKSFLLFVSFFMTISGGSIYAFQQSEKSGEGQGELEIVVQTLKEEVAMLREEVRSLRKLQISRQNPDTAPGTLRRPQHIRPPFSEGNGQNEHLLRSEENDRQKQRLMIIGEQFQAQDIDPRWAYVAEYQLHQLLEETDTSGTPEIEIMCRATLCQLEIAHDDEAELTALGYHLVGKYPSTFSKGLLHRSTEESGKPSFIAYLSRKGHRLPSLEK